MVRGTVYLVIRGRGVPGDKGEGVPGDKGEGCTW